MNLYCPYLLNSKGTQTHAIGEDLLQGLNLMRMLQEYLGEHCVGVGRFRMKTLCRSILPFQASDSSSLHW